jgi:DNA-binding PucR family transcriptional regulator
MDALRELGSGLRLHVAEKPPHLSASVGVSEPFRDLEKGPSAFRQAREAAEMASLRPPGGVALFADLGPHVRALENQPADWLESLARQALGPLLERQEEKDHLLASLNVYVDCNRNVVKAADALFVHPNTLRNRLRKVEELLGRSLEETRTLVDLSLGFEALRILGRKQGTPAVYQLRAAGRREPPKGSTDPGL